MKKKIIKIILAVIVIIAIIVLIALYMVQEQFRNWVDVNILKKDITEEDIVTIDLATDQSNQIHVYNKYIAILNNQTIKLYNNYGQELTQINIGINTGIFDSRGKYLAVAEDGGQQICLILDKTYLWSNSIEGEIQQIHVNKNGYVVVITEDTTYESILTLYNSDGTKLFSSYFSTTRIVDVSISDDNDYIAVGEIDFSGTLIQSNVKIISIENATNSTEDAISYTYSAETGKLLTQIKYQSKGQIACMYDDVIEVIQNEESSEYVKVEDDIAFMSANLSDSIAYVREETSGVFTTNSIVNIVNTQTGETITYNIEQVAKELYAKDNVLAINTGTEIYFINSNANLLKKYSTEQEITNVMFSNQIAAIIYKDKIVIIDI